jgi:hypothetical protein
MRVVAVRHVEDCFDGSYIRELALDAAITREFINYLGIVGRLCYYGEFARPFFIIVQEGKCKLKGVEGDSSMKAIFFDGKTEEVQDSLIRAIGAYSKEVGTV